MCEQSWLVSTDLAGANMNAPRRTDSCLDANAHLIVHHRQFGQPKSEDALPKAHRFTA